MKKIGVVSLLLVLSACNSSSSPAAGGAGSGGAVQANTDPLSPKWSYSVPSAAQGVAVNPVSGDVYLSLHQFGSVFFENTGGILIFDSQGNKTRNVPMAIPHDPSVLPKGFMPNAPLVTRDGSKLVLGSYWWDVFRYETAERAVRLVNVHGENNLDSGDSSIGIDSNSAFNLDETKILIPGHHLYGLDIETGDFAVVADFGMPVHQIVPFKGPVYLANLSDSGQQQGVLGTWNAATGFKKQFTLDLPVKALATRGGWTVGVVVKGDVCGLFELSGTETELNANVLGGFQVNGGSDGCGEVQLALRPEKRQIVIGADGYVGDVGEDTADIQTTAILFDVASKTSRKLDVRHVSGLAITPDGDTLYVSDFATGLKAFALP